MSHARKENNFIINHDNWIVSSAQTFSQQQQFDDESGAHTKVMHDLLLVEGFSEIFPIAISVFSCL